MRRTSLASVTGILLIGCAAGGGAGDVLPSEANSGGSGGDNSSVTGATGGGAG